MFFDILVLMRSISQLQIYESFAGATAVLSHNCARNLHFCDDTANTKSKHQ